MRRTSASSNPASASDTYRNGGSAATRPASRPPRGLSRHDPATPELATPTASHRRGSRSFNAFGTNGQRRPC